MKGKERIGNKVLAALCFTMALILLLSGLGATLAKYIRQDNQAGQISAAPFYFESRELDADGKDQAPTGYQGENVVLTFTLSNYVDDNRYTQQDIDYTYWVYMEGDGNQTPVEGTEKTSGVLSGGTKTEAECTVTLNKEIFEEGDGWVIVEAQSTSPYAKTLFARYSLNYTTEKTELLWNVEEQEGAVVLEIAGGSGSPVTVVYPSSLLADPYNELLQGTSGNTVTFTPQPGTRYALTFLKEGGGTYSNEDFTVTEE